MKTSFAASDLHASVIAVPPLCRDAGLEINAAENARLIRHIESGGVSTLLYGGNANFYNIALSEYEAVLDNLEDAAAEQTWVVPSVGPYYGMMLDQAAILARRRFPAAMVLPASAISTPAGVRRGIADFVERAGIPAVLYIKDDNYVTVETVKALLNDGAIAWIKYAVVRPDPANDPLLRALVDAVDPALIVSGMGEQPVMTQWQSFGLRAFTSGCVCIAPGRSQEMLEALREGDLARAAEIRKQFDLLEQVRNAYGPIAVLHHAVALAGVAHTGPSLPLLAELAPEVQNQIAAAACSLLKWENRREAGSLTV